MWRTHLCKVYEDVHKSSDYLEIIIKESIKITMHEQNFNKEMTVITYIKSGHQQLQISKPNHNSPGPKCLNPKISVYTIYFDGL